MCNLDNTNTRRNRSSSSTSVTVTQQPRRKRADSDSLKQRRVAKRIDKQSMTDKPAKDQLPTHQDPDTDMQSPKLRTSGCVTPPFTPPTTPQSLRSPTASAWKSMKSNQSQSKFGIKPTKGTTPVHPLSVLLLVIIALLSIHAVNVLWFKIGTDFDLRNAERNEALEVVWSSGWITAAATGLGALPFVFVSSLSDEWLGVSNAFASGMMLAASSGLLLEGFMESGVPSELFPPAVRVAAGFWLGVVFILVSKKALDQHSDIKVLDLDALSTKRVLLIMSVMTLHSFSEGVGIGVSYNSQSLGAFISATLAVHNIPEGLAVSIVLVPRGVSVLNTAIWCVVTSLPQPLMAVPAYIFVDQFKLILPIGLGFAAGAMGYVAVFELFLEAKEVIGMKASSGICICAALCMGVFQMLLRESAMS